jgi:magnesium chelatase family protein
MLYDRNFIETSAVVAQRVAVARERMTHRLRGTPWRLNAEIPGAELRRSFAPETGALRSLDRAMELGQVTARGADKIVRVAWSVADLAGRARPAHDEVNVAISLWLGVPL